MHTGFGWGNPKRALRRTRHRWEDSIEMHLKYIGWEGKDWIKLTQCRGKWQAVVNINDCSASMK
jgi:hypothetical protein